MHLRQFIGVTVMVSLKHNTAWIGALRRQEHVAFVELLESCESLVAACGRRCGLREHEVEDVVSSTFLRAYQALPSYRGQAAVSTWLCRIAYNQSITVFRKAGRVTPRQSNDLPDPQRNDPLRCLESRELKDKLDEALQRLPAPWLEAIKLRYWNHMSTTQIAKVMQVSDVAARSYLFRARRRLRLSLETGN